MSEWKHFGDGDWECRYDDFEIELRDSTYGWCSLGLVEARALLPILREFVEKEGGDA